MHGVGSSFAALLLSLFMVSTSVSASACDLSCWLHQTYSDCNNAGAVATNKDGAAMSMSSGMDMRHDPSERIVGPHLSEGAVTDAMPMGPKTDLGTDDSNGMASSESHLITKLGHAMAMPPQFEVVTERFMRVAKAELAARPELNPSGTPSSCLHEPCSQSWISVSPPPGDHSQPGALQRTLTGILNPANVWPGLRRINFESPPSKILAGDPLTTTLRI